MPSKLAITPSRLARFLGHSCVLLVVLAGISLSRDSNSLLDFTLGILWCTWLPLLSSLMIWFSANRVFWLFCIGCGIHFCSAMFSLVLLSIMTVSVIFSGPLNESSIVLVFFVYGFITSVIAGGLLGLIGWFIAVKRDNTNPLSSR